MTPPGSRRHLDRLCFGPHYNRGEHLGELDRQAGRPVALTAERPAHATRTAGAPAIRNEVRLTGLNPVARRTPPPNLVPAQQACLPPSTDASGDIASRTIDAMSLRVIPEQCDRREHPYEEEQREH